MSSGRGLSEDELVLCRVRVWKKVIVFVGSHRTPEKSVLRVRETSCSHLKSHWCNLTLPAECFAVHTEREACLMWAALTHLHTIAHRHYYPVRSDILQDWNSQQRNTSVLLTAESALACLMWQELLCFWPSSRFWFCWKISFLDKSNNFSLLDCRISVQAVCFSLTWDLGINKATFRKNYLA